MNPAEEIPPEAAHRAYYRQPVWKRIVVIAAGPAMNMLIAFLLIWGLFTFSGLSNPDPQKQRYVGAIEKGSPAARAAAAGRPDRLRRRQDRPGRPSRRDRAPTAARAPRPRAAGGTTAATDRRAARRRRTHAAPAPGLRRRDLKRTRLGFSYGFAGRLRAAQVTEPPGAAAVDSLDRMWYVTHATVGAIGRIFYDSQARKQVSGVVGSYEATRQSFEFDTARSAIWVLALISLSLAVINLFPFLPLDGGHIFWALAEKVRGRPIPFRVMERAGFVGFALVACLFVLGLTNDIGRIADGGFQVR